MPLPLIIIAGSAIAGAGGLASAGVGARKMIHANKEMKRIEKRHEANQRRFNDLNQSTTSAMEDLGNLELEVCESFDRFAELIERIQNRPEFDEIKVGSFDVPRYDAQELRDVSIAAGMVVGAVGGAGMGAGGGIAAAMAAKGVIGAVCLASTGTPIATLHGIAATNAIMAVLGGGTLAAGGGGIALGATVLSAATAGVGILIGGIVFNLASRSLSSEVDEAREQMKEAEREIGRICKYLSRLKTVAYTYRKSLSTVYGIYKEHLERFERIVFDEARCDWCQFTDEEKLSLENLVLLVSILYGMCKINLVVEGDRDGINEVNYDEAMSRVKTAEEFMRERGLSDGVD